MLPERLCSPVRSSGSGCWRGVCARGCDTRRGTRRAASAPAVCLRELLQGRGGPPSHPGTRQLGRPPDEKLPEPLRRALQQRARSCRAGSLMETPRPWVNCRELCLQTLLSVGQQAPGEPLHEQPGWELRAGGIPGLWRRLEHRSSDKIRSRWKNA